MEKDPSKRLGVKACKAGDVSQQPFFKNIDFAKLEKKEIKPPYKPKLVSKGKNKLNNNKSIELTNVSQIKVNIIKNSNIDHKIKHYNCQRKIIHECKDLIQMTSKWSTR